MAATANYGLPYPGDLDAPDGPEQIENLAVAVDTQLLRVDNRATPYGAASSASLTVTGTETDIAGTSVTFTTNSPGAIMVVDAVFDFSCNGSVLGTGNHAIGKLSIDGVVQGQQALMRTLPNLRGCVAQTFLLVLVASGSHTVKLRAIGSHTAGTVTANSPHTGWTGVVFDGQSS